MRRALAALLERRLRRSDARLGIVVVYHRTVPGESDAESDLDHVLSIRALERHLRYMRARYRIVPAREIVAEAAHRAQGERFPLAVTFDDDLESHARLVLPVLERLGVPATFFLGGLGLDGPETHWWHDLEHVVAGRLLSAGDLPQLPRQEVEAALDRRPGAVAALGRSFQRLPPDRRDEAARTLRAALPAERRVGVLSTADVRRIAAAGFSVGFHTLRHYDLRTLDARGVEAALQEGRTQLAELAGQPLDLIAYPHGSTDERIEDAARRAGYRLGFTTVPQAVGANSDALDLGRVQPQAPLGRLAVGLVRALQSSAAALSARS